MAPLSLRKQPSGAEKRRRRKKVEEFMKSQANAMLKFLKKPEKSVDMFDPGNWGNVDTKTRDLLVEKGPVTRLSTDYQFPKNGTGSKFSHALYIKHLVNGEKMNRRWLVYSKASDKAFCFCCKLFEHEKQDGDNLLTTGFNDWSNVSTSLKEHERSYDHIKCMVQWRTMEIELEKNQTTDKLIKS